MLWRNNMNTYAVSFKVAILITMLSVITACSSHSTNQTANKSVQGSQKTTVDDLPSNLKDIQIGLALNHQTGNWGVAIAPMELDSRVAFQMALLSCVGKDIGQPLDLSASEQQKEKLFQQYTIAAETGKTQCKPADLSYLGYKPKSLALFRNRLANGKYNFHGAFSKTIDVPHSEFKKQFQECKAESENCKHIQTFSFKGWLSDFDSNGGNTIW